MSHPRRSIRPVINAVSIEGTPPGTAEPDQDEHEGGALSADSDEVNIERIRRAIRTMADIDQDTADEWQAILVTAVGDLDPERRSQVLAIEADYSEAISALYQSS